MYLLRMAGTNADATYNMAWLGLWVAAEVSLGICVISLLPLPKFIEAKGKHWFSRFIQPFNSFSTSWASLTRLRLTQTDRREEESYSNISLTQITNRQTSSEVHLARFEDSTPSKDQSTITLAGTEGRNVSSRF